MGYSMTILAGNDRQHIDGSVAGLSTFAAVRGELCVEMCFLPGAVTEPHQSDIQGEGTLQTTLNKNKCLRAVVTSRNCWQGPAGRF